MRTWCLDFDICDSFELFLLTSYVALGYGPQVCALMLGNEFHIDSLCLGGMHACYVCWPTFDVARGQGPQVHAICPFG